ATAAAVRAAMVEARVDYYASKPRSSRDEDFHRLLGELLQEWSRGQSPTASDATLIGQAGSPRVHELGTLLASSGIAYQFEEHGSVAARRLLAGGTGGQRTTSRPERACRDGPGI